MDESQRPEGVDAFTRAPAVRPDPHALPPRPVRAAFPGLEPPAGLAISDYGPGGEAEPHIRRAILAEPFDDPFVAGTVRCLACAHRCVVRPGRIALCGVRQNRGGWLYTLVYGQVVASKAEPIEKKPLYHFLPGSRAFSIATRGCNFHCDFCQNWEMAQGHREGIVPESRQVSPDEAVDEAVAAGARSIAYTYVEPTVFVEYALDTMVRARAAGLRNVFVTNGYQTPEAVERIAPYLDAANVDLKSSRDATYRRVCGARAAPVREAIVELRRHGVWVELTTLVIPGVNDGSDELAEVADWIVSAVGPETPWHVTRFLPAHKRSGSIPTPASTLVAAAARGRAAGLRHVYVGNVPEAEDAATRCARCGEIVIERRDYAVTAWHLRDGRCPTCGYAPAGVGLERSPVAAQPRG